MIHAHPTSAGTQHVYATDLPRALAWYHDRFGLEMQPDAAPASGPAGAGAIVSNGDVRLCVHSKAVSGGTAQRAGGWAHIGGRICLEVPSADFGRIDQEFASVQERGKSARGIDWCLIIDPDGNAIILCQGE